jgi:hypothetical protein
MVAAKVHRAKVKKLATKGKKKKVSTSLNFYLGSTPTDSFSKDLVGGTPVGNNNNKVILIERILQSSKEKEMINEEPEWIDADCCRKSSQFKGKKDNKATIQLKPKSLNIESVQQLVLHVLTDGPLNFLTVNNKFLIKKVVVLNADGISFSELNEIEPSLNNLNYIFEQKISLQFAGSKYSVQSVPASLLYVENKDSLKNYNNNNNQLSKLLLTREILSEENFPAFHPGWCGEFNDVLLNPVTSETFISLSGSQDLGICYYYYHFILLLYTRYAM